MEWTHRRRTFLPLHHLRTFLGKSWRQIWAQTHDSTSNRRARTRNGTHGTRTKCLATPLPPNAPRSNQRIHRINTRIRLINNTKTTFRLCHSHTPKLRLSRSCRWFLHRWHTLRYRRRTCRLHLCRHCLHHQLHHRHDICPRRKKPTHRQQKRITPQQLALCRLHARTPHTRTAHLSRAKCHRLLLARTPILHRTIRRAPQPTLHHHRNLRWHRRTLQRHLRIYWGKRSDRKGYGKTIRLAAIVTGTATILQAFVPHYIWLFPLRAIAGIFTAALIPTLYAAFSKNSPAENRAGLMGIASGATLFGNLIAPILCGWIASYWGIHIALILPGILMFIVWIGSKKEEHYELNG